MKTQLIVTTAGKARITMKGSNWYIRCTVRGTRHDAPLDTANQATAASRAKALLSASLTNPWEEIYNPIIGREERILSIEDYIILYDQYCRESELAPYPITAKRYKQYFRLIAKKLGYTALTDYEKLNVKDLRKHYSNSVTINTIITSLKAMFKNDVMKWLNVQGIKVVNPLENISMARSTIEPYTPIEKTDIKDMEDCIKTLDNDLQLAFLLVYRLAMRRREADMARFNWLTELESGAVITIKSEDNFTPKSKKSRQIIIGQELLEQIKTLRGDSDCEYLIPAAPNNNKGYRLRYRWDVLSKHLAKYGMTPHRCRKHGGSVFATAHGLMAAKTLLGHQKVSLTESYYATLVNLPVIN